MKGFDVEKYFNKMREVSDVDEFQKNFGYEYDALVVMTAEERKKAFLNRQKELGKNGTVVSSINRENNDLFNNEAMKDKLKDDTFIPSYDEINNIVGNLVCAKFNKNKISKNQTTSDDLWKLLKNSVKMGWNIYPLMVNIQENINNLSKKENTPEEIKEIEDYKDALALLKMSEIVSPYTALFSLSNKLGKYITELDDKRKKEEYDQRYDELESEIDKLKELISSNLKDYDLDILVQTISDKEKYIKSSETNISTKSAQWIEYQGLRNLRLIAQQEITQNKLKSKSKGTTV